MLKHSGSVYLKLSWEGNNEINDSKSHTLITLYKNSGRNSVPVHSASSYAIYIYALGMPLTRGPRPMNLCLVAFMTGTT